MRLNFINKKYTPIYLLAAGVFVFIFAFYYASIRSPKIEEKTSNEDNQLNNAGGETNPSIGITVSETPIPTKEITSTLRPTRVVVTSTLTPTVTITLTPSLSPTPTVTAPTNTLTPTESPTPTPIVPTDLPTLSPTP